MSDQLRGPQPVRSYEDVALELRITQAKLDTATDVLADVRAQLTVIPPPLADAIDAVLARAGKAAPSVPAVVTPVRVRTARDILQARVFRWVLRTFGERIAVTRGERVSRVLEEAVELAQAEGLTATAASRIVTHVYSKPPGDPQQEAGGLGITLLAYCEAAGISAEARERGEFDRVEGLPAHHFRQRQAAKAAAGIAICDDTMERV